MATIQDEARIQVAVRGKGSRAHVVDVPMPSQVPLGDNLAELIPFLRRELDAQGRDTEWLDDREAHWTLRKPFHTEELDPEKSLLQAKITDGDRLLLVKRTPGEKFPPLIDDVAEAIAYWLKQFFPSWDYRMSQRVSLSVLPVVVALLCALALRYTGIAQPQPLTRIIMAAAAAAPALLLTILTVVIIRADKVRYRAMAVPLLVIIYLLTGSAAVIAIPQAYSLYQLMAAAAALLTLAILLAVITGTNIRIHYAVATASLVIIAVGAVNLAYPSPTEIVAAQVIVLATMILLMSGRISMPLAKISLPIVPPTGESFVADTDRPGDLDAGDLTGDGAANEAIFNQKQQVLTWYDSSTGLIAGALTVTIFAAWTLGYTTTIHPWILFALTVITATILVYRGKTEDDALMQGLCLVGAAATLSAYGAGLMFSDHYADNLPQAVSALAILLAACTFAAVWAVQERKITSPLSARFLEIIEKLLCAAPWPLLIFAMDLYQKARTR